MPKPALSRRRNPIAGLAFVALALVAFGPANAAAQPLEVTAEFIPSGWMGDGMEGMKHIDFDDAWREAPHSPPTAIRVAYRPSRNVRWAGIYWQNVANNWGEKAGEDWSARGYTRLSFWARGETGTEVVEFKAGDIEALGQPYKDSFKATTGRVALNRAWTRHEIDLRGKDLKSVIGGFAWVAAAAGNPAEIVFYLDDVVYE